jgi:hypothetical protein
MWQKKKAGSEYAVSTNTDLYAYDLETGKTSNLTEGMMGYDTHPVFCREWGIGMVEHEARWL